MHPSKTQFVDSYSKGWTTFNNKPAEYQPQGPLTPNPPHNFGPVRTNNTADSSQNWRTPPNEFPLQLHNVPLRVPQHRALYDPHQQGGRVYQGARPCHQQIPLNPPNLNFRAQPASRYVSPNLRINQQGYQNQQRGGGPVHLVQQPAPQPRPPSENQNRGGFRQPLSKALSQLSLVEPEPTGLTRSSAMHDFFQPKSSPNQPLVTNEDIENDQNLRRVEKNIFYNPKRIIGSNPTTHAEVYHGFWKDGAEFPKEVAVKRFPKGCKMNDLHILYKLEYRHIVRYFNTEICPRSHDTFLAMEMAEGTLEDAVNANERFKFNRLRWYLYDAIKGLQYLHSKNIIHRDIKPSNILICHISGKGWAGAKLADFGVSRQLKDMDYGTITELKGTPLYMPPEAVRLIGQKEECEKFVNKPSFDFFSLGITIFYTMSYGKHPFQDPVPSAINTTYNIINRSPYWQLINSDDHTCMSNLVQPLLSKEPEERPKSCKAILEHPFFWDIKHRQYQFLAAVCDDIRCNKVTGYRIIQDVENSFQQFWNRKHKNQLQFNWVEKLCTDQKFKLWFLRGKRMDNYYSTKILGLATFIYDKCKHYEEWEKFGLMQNSIFGSDGTKYMNFFVFRFLFLFPFLYAFFQDKSKCGVHLLKFYQHNTNSCFKNLYELPTLE